MSTNINAIYVPFAEQINAMIHTLASKVTQHTIPGVPSQAAPSRFVPRKPPISDEVAKEIERLELAIRHGSVNAYG